jgi:hypothetical protein
MADSAKPFELWQHLQSLSMAVLQSLSGSHCKAFLELRPAVATDRPKSGQD